MCVCVSVLLVQGVVGTENSLKSALVTAFSDGELDLEGDERGLSTEGGPLVSLLLQMAEPRQS